ncbi:hypothetical protein [Streptomyces anulatus]|uniref:hypothetical protein n=1 Tax=Streptomyces anulatus TaxID=1892 RepID=UPI001C266C37|nr:hypothetical protein [Streptomyces anulatus]
MHQQLQWIMTMIGSLFIMVLSLRAFSMWIKQEYVAAATTLLGAGVIFVAVYFPSLVTDLADNALAALTGAGEESPAAEPSPGPHAEPTGTDIEWMPLLAGLGGVIALALLGGIAAVLRAQRRRRTAEHQRRTELEARHDSVRDAYADFTADILAVLDRPALNDVSTPQTERLVLALDAARDARTAPGTADYSARVIALEIAWKAADQHARKAGIKHLAPAERRAVEQARHLLTTALDDAGNVHERHAAYRKAIKLMGTIIDIPHEAVAAVEAATRRALLRK